MFLLLIESLSLSKALSVWFFSILNHFNIFTAQLRSISFCQCLVAGPWGLGDDMWWLGSFERVLYSFVHSADRTWQSMQSVVVYAILCLWPMGWDVTDLRWLSRFCDPCACFMLCEWPGQSSDAFDPPFVEREKRQRTAPDFSKGQLQQNSSSQKSTTWHGDTATWKKLRCGPLQPSHTNDRWLWH